jgi:hypothetical protein
MPLWTHDKVLLNIKNKINPGEKIFVDYHWISVAWNDVGGKWTHSYLKQQEELLWREIITWTWLKTFF